MLTAELTPHQVGIKISGTHADFEHIYDAIWNVTVTTDPTDKSRAQGTPEEAETSTRLLALCYDLRHAAMGTRNVEFVDNGFGEWAMSNSGKVGPRQNVVFSFEVFVPEMLYDLMAMGYLSQLHRCRLAGRKRWTRNLPDSPKLHFDEDALAVDLLCAKVMAAFERKLSSGNFSRVRKQVYEGAEHVCGMYTHWVDEMCRRWFSGLHDGRDMADIATDLARYYDDPFYEDLVDSVNNAAREQGVAPTDVRDQSIEWPDEMDVDW